MTSRFHCVHCDNRFELTTAETQPRCPQCMRRNGVELVGEMQKAPESKGWLMWGVLPAAVLALIGGVIWWVAGPTRLEEVVPTRPLSAKELHGYLEREGVPEPRWSSFLSLSDAPDGSAEELLALAQSKSTHWALDAPLDRPVRGADEVAAALQNEKQSYYPLELAAWLAVALREQGEDALVAEVWEFEGDTRPPDPSGLFGYFGVVIDSGDEAVVLDPMRGAARKPAANGWRSLTDTQAIGAALGTEAMRYLFDSGDGATALKLVQKALVLDPKSPALRGVHASVLLDSSALDDAIKELQAAHDLRPDGPRKVGLARLYTAQAAMAQMRGDGETAATQWGLATQLATQAEQKYPDFSRAHLAMATVYMGQDDTERARVSLERAQQLEPDSVVLPTAWAQYYVQLGEMEQAALSMQRAVDLRPKNWQLRLQAAQVYQAANDLDQMRTHARAAVELVAPDKRGQLRSQLLQGLGPTALDEPGAGGDEPSEEEGDDELSDADLEAALPDPGQAIGAAVGGPVDEGDSPTLRLRDPGETLQLDLGE